MQESFKQFLSDAKEPTKWAFLLTIATLATGLGSLAFNLIVARKGGAAAYGAVSSLLLATTIAGFVAGGTQFAVARATATSELPNITIMRRAFKQALPFLAGALLYTAVILPFSGFLKIGSLVPGLLSGLTILLMVVGAIPVGIMWGRGWFLAIAAVTTMGIIIRVAFGYFFITVNDAITIGILASVVTGVFTIIASVLIVLIRQTSIPSIPSSMATTTSIGTSSLLGMVLTAGSWMAWSLPLFFARHYLPANATGSFAAATNVASSIIFLTGPIVTTFFPTIARKLSRNAAIAGLLLTLLVGACGTLILGFTGNFFLYYLYGKSYAIGNPIVMSLALSATLVSAITFVATSLFASNKHALWINLSFAVLIASEAVSLQLMPHSLLWYGYAPSLGVAVASVYLIASYLAKYGLVPKQAKSRIEQKIKL